MRIATPPERLISDAARAERPLFHARYPHVVTVGWHYPDMDRIHRWMWVTFGPRDGVCDQGDSDAPACPIVLSKSQVVLPEDPADDPEYNHTSPIERHSHAGTWSTLWLGKCGYDYGHEDIGVSTPRQLELLLKYLEFYGPGLGDGGPAF